LPELEPDDAAEADVTIRLRPLATPFEIVPGAVIDLSSATQTLAWRSVGRFSIHGARAIDVEPSPDVGEGLIRLPLLGPVMALLLYLRGLFVLHASAIEVAGRGAIFVGNRRAGKSTTGAALVAAGHRLLADDVVAIDVAEGGRPLIRAGFPQLKLDKTVPVPGIAEHAVALPPVEPNFAKLQHRLVEPFSHADTSPERIYVLTRGSAAAATPLAPAQALAAILRFSYLSRFDSGVLAGAHAVEHFRRSAALSAAVSVFRLTIPEGVERLGEIVRLVELGTLKRS
jgi:hypothetical protein